MCLLMLSNHNGIRLAALVPKVRSAATKGYKFAKQAQRYMWEKYALKVFKFEKATRNCELCVTEGNVRGKISKQYDCVRRRAICACTSSQPLGAETFKVLETLASANLRRGFRWQEGYWFHVQTEAHIGYCFLALLQGVLRVCCNQLHLRSSGDKLKKRLVLSARHHVGLSIARNSSHLAPGGARGHHLPISCLSFISFSVWCLVHRL